MTEATSSEFLLYIGSDDVLIWDLLPTLPTVFMLIEFPFNMIPIDWPMLVFVELLFTFFMLINFIIVSLREDHENIYSAFNWYYQTEEAIGYVLGCYLVLAAVFAIFWAISQRWKLPRYAKRMEHRYETMSQFVSSPLATKSFESDQNDREE